MAAWPWLLRCLLPLPCASASSISITPRPPAYSRTREESPSASGTASKKAGERGEEGEVWGVSRSESTDGICFLARVEEAVDANEAEREEEEEEREEEEREEEEEEDGREEEEEEMGREEEEEKGREEEETRWQDPREEEASFITLAATNVAVMLWMGIEGVVVASLLGVWI